MRPLPFVLPWAVFFWSAYAWAFLPEVRAVRKAMRDAATQDAGSLRVITYGTYVGILGAIFAAFLAESAAMGGDRGRWIAFAAGTLMLIAGSALRRHCFRLLGEHFQFAVSVREAQPVISSGPYRYVRHPSYTGGVVMLTGFGVALGNWVSVAVLFATTVVMYAYRVAVEERALVATLGQPYVDYMRRTKRFIPFVF